MIPVDDARAAVLGRVPVLGAVTLSLRRASGRRLAADVRAAADVPPFDNSAMDGFALRSADTEGAPVELAVTGETAAGDPPGPTLPPGSARSVMTGAPLPPGADAVARLERTGDAGGGRVRILDRVAAGTSVRRAGCDIRNGTTPLERGRLLRAYELGVLASLGVAFVDTVRTPSVAVIPTGAELAGPGRPLAAGQIRESNAAVVAELARAEGCDTAVLDPVPDDPGAIGAAIARAAGADVIVTTGGVSAGRYDAVPGVLEGIGAEIVFHRVNIKPGMPTLFALLGSSAVFGLPGNPVSAAVTFLQFVRPALRRMSGDPDPGRRTTAPAMFEGRYEKRDGKRHFLRGILRTDGDGARVRTAGGQDSNIASALSAANCLIVIPENAAEVKDSDIVETEPL